MVARTPRLSAPFDLLPGHQAGQQRILGEIFEGPPTARIADQIRSAAEQDVEALRSAPPPRRSRPAGAPVRDPRWRRAQYSRASQSPCRRGECRQDWRHPGDRRSPAAQGRRAAKSPGRSPRSRAPLPASALRARAHQGRHGPARAFPPASGLAALFALALPRSRNDPRRAPRRPRPRPSARRTRRPARAGAPLSSELESSAS